MSIRNDAKAILAKLTEASRLPKSAPPRSQIEKINDQLVRLLSSDEMSPLMDFLTDYSPRTTSSYGYLFDPIPTVDLKPALKASKNPRSQYYCARYKVEDYGWIYLVPLLGDPDFALVLKPSRPLRRDIHVNSATVKGFSLTVVYPPYEDLGRLVLVWAVVIEAIKLQHDNKK